MSDQRTYYVTQWLSSSGEWNESIGAHMQGDNQQHYWATERLGITADPLSLEGAQAFADVLREAGSAARVRIVKRTDEVVEG